MVEDVHVAIPCIWRDEREEIEVFAGGVIVGGGFVVVVCCMEARFLLGC